MVFCASPVSTNDIKSAWVPSELTRQNSQLSALRSGTSNVRRCFVEVVLGLQRLDLVKMTQLERAILAYLGIQLDDSNFNQRCHFDQLVQMISGEITCCDAVYLVRPDERNIEEEVRLY